MKSRMDKYNLTDDINLRTKKNQNLYDEVRNSSLEDFDLNSNVSVIDSNAEVIDVNKVIQILDNRYNSDIPKRKSIVFPETDQAEIEDVNTDTKEYDINAIINKAKQGKDIDYNKDRLRKVHEAQYEILNNLDLELKRVDDNSLYKKDKEAEENLMNLINTITQIEINNKNNYNKENSEALQLLSDLAETPEQTEEIRNNIIEEDEIVEDKEETVEEDEINEKTIKKLNISNNYDDFADIQYHDKSSVFFKITIFVLIVLLVIGALFIVDHLLELGIFEFLNK